MMSCRFRVSSIIQTCCIGYFLILFVMGCASHGGGKSLGEMDPCKTLDSLYASSGFESHVSMTGKITFDVEQYRIRGQFTLVAAPDGDMGLDFSNSTLFGSQHEDISVSLAGGVIRVLDRERGAYYEGGDVDEALKEMIGLDPDVGEIVALALGAVPPCANLPGGKIHLAGDGEIVYASRSSGEKIRIAFDEGTRRIRYLEYPLSLSGGKIARLLVDYAWEQSDKGTYSLKKLILSVPSKGWRIKLISI
jgi:hypothetical protein